MRFFLRSIEERFGREEVDLGWDEIVFCFTSVEEWRGQIRFEAHIDRSHENPWYHAMVVCHSQLNDQQRIKLKHLLEEHAIAPSDDR